MSLGTPVEESERFFHRHVQDVMDVLSVIADGENLRLVTRAFAILADQFHVGQKLHFHGDRAIAGAGFAAAAGNVERKMSGGVAMLLGLGKGSEELANRIECLDVGHRIGARSASDGRLIHQLHLIKPLLAFEFARDRPR